MHFLLLNDGFYMPLTLSCGSELCNSILSYRVNGIVEVTTSWTPIAIVIILTV